MLLTHYDVVSEAKKKKSILDPLRFKRMTFHIKNSFRATKLQCHWHKKECNILGSRE